MAAYLELYYSGKLAERVKAGRVFLQSCQVCPRHCRVNRLAGEIGECHTTQSAVVSSYGPHFGEEAPLVGRNGSGTIFFTNCNLKCVFCQNYSISQLGDGETRCGGGEHCVWRTQGVERAEQVLLQRQVLGRGLDHELRLATGALKISEGAYAIQSLGGRLA